MLSLTNKIENLKFDKLITYLINLKKVAVAFSGGVDSSFLLAACKIALDENVIAIIIDSPALPRYEMEDAQKIIELVNVKLLVLKSSDINEEIKHNPIDRCYFCKKTEFGSIKQEALKLGFEYVLDGTNADDLKDYRPGMKAKDEVKVLSPLLENGITKAEIREFSKILGLPTWDKPAYACLYSRIPYGQEIKLEDLRKIELAENFFIDKGIKTIRVRCHNDLARIETDTENMDKLFREPLKSEIIYNLKSFGFSYITVDLLGYRMGSFNEKINKYYIPYFWYIK